MLKEQLIHNIKSIINNDEFICDINNFITNPKVNRFINRLKHEVKSNISTEVSKLLHS